MNQRIAQVTTAVMVDGVRTLIAPGQALPAASGGAPADRAAAPPAAMPEPQTQHGPGDKPSRKVVGA